VRRLAEADTLLDLAGKAELAAFQKAKERHALRAAKLLAGRGEIALRQGRYSDSVEHFKEAAALVPDGHPAQSADYLGRQAEALYREGCERGDNSALNRSIETWRIVLQYRPRDRVPLDWAATQHGLGNVLVRLGEREVGAAQLTEAVAAYQAALQERKRDELPVDWAMTTGNQGIALMLLAQRLGDANKARLAVQQIEIASVTMRDHENAALAADYNRQALKAQTLLRQLTTR
jgi:tetratricopeptide (TPR) repeat protein